MQIIALMIIIILTNHDEMFIDDNTFLKMYFPIKVQSIICKIFVHIFGHLFSCDNNRQVQ